MKDVAVIVLASVESFPDVAFDVFVSADLFLLEMLSLYLIRSPFVQLSPSVILYSNFHQRLYDFESILSEPVKLPQWSLPMVSAS